MCDITSHRFTSHITAGCQITSVYEIPKQFSCRFDCYIVKSKSVGIELAYLYNGNYLWKSLYNFVL